MAAEGATRAELNDALRQLLLDVRAAGADDDTEEIINSVGDRLHGWCAARWHIHARDVADVAPPARNGRSAPAGAVAPTDTR